MYHCFLIESFQLKSNLTKLCLYSGILKERNILDETISERYYSISALMIAKEKINFLASKSDKSISLFFSAFKYQIVHALCDSQPSLSQRKYELLKSSSLK